MTVKEAYKKIVEMFPNMRIVKCIEYESLYTFQLAPSNLDNANVDKILAGIIGVNKHTGVVEDFKPFRLSPEEYRRGKEVNVT